MFQTRTAHLVVQRYTKKSDILSYLKGHCRELKTQTDAAAASSSDKATKYHLQDLSDRLKKILDPK